MKEESRVRNRSGLVERRAGNKRGPKEPHPKWARASQRRQLDSGPGQRRPRTEGEAQLTNRRARRDRKAEPATSCQNLSEFVDASGKKQTASQFTVTRIADVITTFTSIIVSCALRQLHFHPVTGPKLAIIAHLSCSDQPLCKCLVIPDVTAFVATRPRT